MRVLILILCCLLLFSTCVARLSGDIFIQQDGEWINFRHLENESRQITITHSEQEIQSERFVDFFLRSSLYFTKQINYFDHYLDCYGFARTAQEEIYRKTGISTSIITMQVVRNTSNYNYLWGHAAIGVRSGTETIVTKDNKIKILPLFTVFEPQSGVYWSHLSEMKYWGPDPRVKSEKVIDDIFVYEVARPPPVDIFKY